jgi:hypothetical protein
MLRGGIETTIGHWSHLFGGLVTTPQDFYAAVEAELKRRDIPDCRLSRVDWAERGFTSAKREYLRAEREEFLIDVCGAPFGNDFFASSWLCAPPPNIMNAIAYAVGALALLGFLVAGNLNLGVFRWLLVVLVLIGFLGIVGVGIIRPLFFPPRLTYYRIDTADMFYRAVQEAVSDVVDGFCKVQGLRILSEADRKPIMRDYGSRSHVGPQSTAA